MLISFPCLAETAKDDDDLPKVTTASASVPIAKTQDNDVEMTKEQMVTAGVEIASAEAHELTALITSTGELKPDPDGLAFLCSGVSGQVKTVKGKVGDRVQKGETLAQVVSPDFAVTSAEAVGFQAQLELAQENLSREQSLFQQGLVPKRDLIAAEAENRKAKAEIEANRQKLQSLTSSVKSPISGIIGERDVTLGQVVETGRKLFTVVNLSKLVLSLDILTHDLPRIKEGQPVTLEIEAVKGQAFSGQIRSISPLIEETTRTAKIQVEVANQSGLLRPGLFVTATISTGEKAEDDRMGCLLPKDAVCRFEGKNVVFVREPEVKQASFTRFLVRPVKTGDTIAGQVEVIDGLKPGELVAVKGAFSILSTWRAGELGQGDSD